MATEDIGARHARQQGEAAAAIALGDKALRDKNFDRAIELYSQAITSAGLQGPDLGKAYFVRGVAYQAKKDCVNAVADYDKAAETLTTNADLYFNRSVCEAELKQPDKSLSDLDKAIKVNPDSALYHSARCVALFNKPDFAGALPDCEAGLRSTPDDKNLLLAVSQSAERTGDKAKAAAAYRHLLQLDPGNKVAADGLKRVGG